MVKLTIYLEPPLTGVLGKLYHIVEGNYYFLINLLPSENGVIIAALGGLAPGATYTVVFPEQTINGVTYLETGSENFNLYSDVTLNVKLIPAITPPIHSAWGLLAPLLPVVVGVVLVKSRWFR